MRLDENWIRAHLPPELADAPIDCFAGEYLDGLTVMAQGERGGPDTAVFRAESEAELRWWQLEQVCRFLPEKDPPPGKTWRYTRDRAENGKWLYIEHRPYDYNAIEDPRLPGFERFLRNLRYRFPTEHWEAKVRECVRLMNFWYRTPHWDYDRDRLRFIEISDSRERDENSGPEEPRPGSVIRVVEEGEGCGRNNMEKHSEQDLQYAAEFREEVHREALEIVRKTRPNVTEVLDRHPVEDYFQEHWDYPGKWYTVISIPYGYGSRKALVDTLVRDTLSGRVPEKERTYTQELRDMGKPEPSRRRLANQLDGKPEGYEERFTVEVDQKNRSFRAVGVDAKGRYILEQYEEYSLGSATGSAGSYYVLTELEYGRYARLALINGQLKEEEYARLTGKDRETDFVVYRDKRYTLGMKEDWPYLVIDGSRYQLSCSPVEPCLYITDRYGNQTAVHYALDPRDVLRDLRDGRPVISITGRSYNALDFCRMVEYAAGRREIGMGDAEQVFGDGPMKKEAPAEPSAEKQQAEEPVIPPREDAPAGDPFYALLAEYPACAVDYCILEGDLPRYRGCEAHRQVLARACRKLLGEDGWQYDLNRARGKLCGAGRLFSQKDPGKGLSYRKAFLCPPQGGYTDADFRRVNAALFPKGTDQLEVYEWTTDWSDYFDEGREWWGTLCLTVYDRAADRFVVILASASD